MNALKRMMIVGVALTALAGCGGAGDPQELAEDVVSYLQDGDFQGFMDNLVASPQELIEVCPATTSYQVDQFEHNRRFLECIAFGMEDAEINAILPTLFVDARCGPAIEAAHEIIVPITTKTAVFKLKLRDAVNTNNGWKLTNEIRCEL